MTRSHRREDAFTLVEVLVVILILGVLAGIGVPAYLHERDTAIDARVAVNLTEVRGSLILYRAGTRADVYTDDVEALADYGYPGSELAVSTIELSADATGFCVSAVSPTGSSFHATDSAAVAAGDC
ncbi:MAG: prepilin-type N-terminal cleavage/methylation domain-containing protein [Microbacteriaceae bacterium]